MKNYCGKDDCLMTCDECKKRTLGSQIKSEPSKPKPTKEKVGLPFKVPLMKDKKTGEVAKTGIISMFTGTPRRDRRKHFRNRVRESSIETFHPKNKEKRKAALNFIRAENIKKNMRKEFTL